MDDRCKACGKALAECLQLTDHGSAGHPIYAHCCPHCSHNQEVLRARMEEDHIKRAIRLVGDSENEWQAYALRCSACISLLLDDPRHVQGLVYQVDLEEGAAAALLSQLHWLQPEVKVTGPTVEPYTPVPEMLDQIDDCRAVWRIDETILRVTRYNLVSPEIVEAAPGPSSAWGFWEVKRDGEAFAVDVDTWEPGGWVSVLDKYRRTGRTRLIGEKGREECEQEAMRLAWSVLGGDQ